MSYILKKKPTTCLRICWSLPHTLKSLIYLSGDALFPSGYQFSTMDHDMMNIRCAWYGSGGWWFLEGCGSARPNGEPGRYYIWNHPSVGHYRLIASQIMVRRDKQVGWWSYVPKKEGLKRLVFSRSFELKSEVSCRKGFYFLGKLYVFMYNNKFKEGHISFKSWRKVMTLGHVMKHIKTKLYTKF